MLNINGNWRILCPDLEICRVKFIQVRVTTRRQEWRIPPLGNRRNFALQYINEIVEEHQQEEQTNSDIFLQRIKLAVQSRLPRAFRNALLQSFQLCVLSNLVGDRHILSLGIEFQGPPHALARRAFKSCLGRNAHGCSSIGIFLGNRRYRRRRRWRCRDIAGVSTNRRELGLHRFIAVLLRLWCRGRGVEQEGMRCHLKPDTLRRRLCAATLPARLGG